MSIAKKTTHQEHSIYHLDIGEEVFVYAVSFCGLESLIGNSTHLCKITGFNIVEVKCYSCHSSKFEVEYEVEIVDSIDKSTIGNVFNISKHTATASKRQIEASYFGHWQLHKDENIVGKLELIKKIIRPDYFGFEETNDLIHLIFPNPYYSVIIPKKQLDKDSIDFLRINFDKVNSAGYGTIDTDDGGGKIKGWYFVFKDKTLNFTI